MNTYYVAKYNPADPTTANTWEVYHTVTNPSGKELPLDVDTTKLDPKYVADGAIHGTAAHKGYIMKFDTSGQQQTGSPSVINMVNFKQAGIDVGGADDSQTLTMNYKEPTQYASPFEVRQFKDVDGATTGYLSKVDIDPDGNILASYSNGKDRIVGRVAMARVSNEQGLSQLGGTLWNVTQESGDAV